MKVRKLLRMQEVKELTGTKHTTIYRRINAGLFPPPLKSGPTVNVYPEDEIAAINDAYITGKTPDEIRELVVSLVEARKSQAVIN